MNWKDVIKKRKGDAFERRIEEQIRDHAKETGWTRSTKVPGRRRKGGGHGPARGRKAPSAREVRIGVGGSRDEGRVTAYKSQIAEILTGMGAPDQTANEFIEKVLRFGTSQRRNLLQEFAAETELENDIVDFLYEAINIWEDIPLASGNREQHSENVDYATGLAAQKELWPEEYQQHLNPGA